MHHGSLRNIVWTTLQQNTCIYNSMFLFLPCSLMTWWRHQMETFSALLSLCAGNSPVPVNSPHEGQWRGALMFSLICARKNDWVNNREAGDLRRHRGHYGVIVMNFGYFPIPRWVSFIWCLPFSKRRSQMHFHEWKGLYFDSNFTDVLCWQ